MRCRVLAGAVAPFVLLAGCSGAGGHATPSASGADSGKGSTTTAPPEDGSVTIGAAGDVLPHYSVQRSAERSAGGSGYDFVPMFAGVKELLSEPDLSLCHMETPVSPDDGLTAAEGMSSTRRPRSPTPWSMPGTTAATRRPTTSGTRR